MTLIGGQVLAGTPAPQGASWFSSTQFSAASAPMMKRPAPVEMRTSLAPGAAPCWTAPRRARRATGDDAVDVRAVAAERQRVGVDVVRHLLHRARALGQVAQGLVVGDHGAAAVGLLEVRVRRVDTGVDDPDRDTLAGQRAAVGAGEGLGRLEAAGGLVGGLGEEPDRLGAGLDVRAHRTGCAASGSGPWCRGRRPRDLAEGHLPVIPVADDGLGGVGQRHAVDEDGGLAGERGQLLARGTARRRPAQVPRSPGSARPGRAR